MSSPSYVLDQPLATRVEESTAGDVTTTYVGYAAPGTVETKKRWQIRKIVSDSVAKTTSVTFAEGSERYDKAWSDRTELTYS